jgi:hypothetical protein
VWHSLTAIPEKTTPVTLHLEKEKFAVVRMPNHYQLFVRLNFFSCGSALSKLFRCSAVFRYRLVDKVL